MISPSKILNLFSHFSGSSVMIFGMFCLFGCANKKSSQQYNFVVIFCDDLGYGDLSSFGHPTIKTPYLDKLAAEGQKWTQFYVADPVCTPSRAALLTGRYPIRNGMTSEKRGVLFPDSKGGLPQSEITIAELLKQKDYSTAIIGKWHLGHLPEFLPSKQGFDYYFGIPYSNDMDGIDGAWWNYFNNKDDPDFYPDIDQFQVPIMENDSIVERPADQNTITQRYTDRAIRFIKDNQKNPFFLYLPHSMPHIPLFVSKEHRGKSKGGLYGDVIEEIDYNIGRIINTIDSLNLDKNTLLIFTSDNGPWLSYKAHGGSAGPLRAGKGTTFEGGQRVPTIMWGPGIVKKGVVQDMGSTLDILPTIASIAGIPLPRNRKLDGFNLEKTIRNLEYSPRDEFYYWAFGQLHAVRSGPWKLHLKQREEINYGKVVDLDVPELFHLERDIGEKYNLSDEYPEHVDRLKSKVTKHLKDVSNSLPDQLALKIE